MHGRSMRQRSFTHIMNEVQAPVHVKYPADMQAALTDSAAPPAPAAVSVTLPFSKAATTRSLSSAVSSEKPARRSVLPMLPSTLSVTHRLQHKCRYQVLQGLPLSQHLCSHASTARLTTAAMCWGDRCRQPSAAGKSSLGPPASMMTAGAGRL